MKVAAVSNNGTSISAHFGKARYFVVLTIEAGKIANREVIDREAVVETPIQSGTNGRALNVINQHSHEHEHDSKNHTGNGKHHNIEPIAGCEAVLSRGMGMGMLQRLEQANIRAILTDVMSIDEAVEAYLGGKLANHPDLVH
ncbi:MAG: hypothetical protein HXX08_14095 [Chloroflexi bacterium]|uniref:NifB/NifX family molybdenum-iron cluster-binding protein n=1 Tax=Candidatus Chlorohelix allophototropha TaxID=3003348 RepID=A0A8T7M4H8_9CHLR|nr:hypothetical protein [Chloroflexota bacterium]WJW70016.1 NifB/NifX family molybdenum-iron cluster-binding protein [Chloroflexota bacterium L227-S17]